MSESNSRVFSITNGASRRFFTTKYKSFRIYFRFTVDKTLLTHSQPVRLAWNDLNIKPRRRQSESVRSTHTVAKGTTPARVSSA